MTGIKVYISAAEQISLQNPLSTEWMVNTKTCLEKNTKAINPDFKKYISPKDSRRMGGILKRAIAVSQKVIEEAGGFKPAAIITGTGNGCLECGEKFLKDVITNDEEALSPSLFIQSTYNTIGSTIAIATENHSYNTTISHGSISFDYAVLDAWMLLRLGKVPNALVGGHDETMDNVFELLNKAGVFGFQGMAPYSDISMSMFLSNTCNENTLCELVGIRIMNNPSSDELKKNIDELMTREGLNLDDVSFVMTGKNGNPLYDSHYHNYLESVCADIPEISYKFVFGENLTASAMSVYSAAHCLKKGFIPECMKHKTHASKRALNSILILNISMSCECSIILLRKNVH